jgi:excisionase family DNA binding protein
VNSNTELVSDDDPNPLAPDEGVPRLLLKVPQACLALGVSRSQLYALMKSGEITGILVGPHQRRIPVTEIQAYISGKLALAREGAA